MKKTTFTLLLSLSCCWLAAQCPTGDITFSTQGQVDSFQINYPGCMNMPGTVAIEDSDIINLQGLSTLDSIGGCLRIINNPLLANLDGLENLRYVGECMIWILGSGHTEGLTISGNEVLASLAGLNRLKTVKDGVSIVANPAMTELNGLDSLSDVGTGIWGLGTSDPAPSYSIQISENSSLKKIGGLANLDSLAILEISLNDSLLSLEGLENLRAIGWSLRIAENYSLKNLFGLDNLQFIGVLWIQGNFSLENFHGLQNLKTIQGCIGFGEWAPPTFLVAENFSLVDFSGLENLQGNIWGCDMIIELNYSLQSLASLSGNFNSLSFLRIEFNPFLSICEAPPICAYLENSGDAAISDNAPGCNSIAEVEAACIVSIEETSGSEPVIVFSPNPADDFLQVQINDPEKWEISLFDLQGRQMFRQRVSGSQTTVMRDWPSGLYTLRAVSSQRFFSGKIVKQ